MIEMEFEEQVKDLLNKEKNYYDDDNSKEWNKGYKDAIDYLINRISFFNPDNSDTIKRK